MKILSYSVGLAVLLHLMPCVSSAQPAPPNDDGALIARFPIPSTTLPLNSTMPYDVMIGYIVGDSLARNLSLAKEDSVFRSLGYSDTLRYALKYYYQMADYDPVRLFLWGSYIPGTIKEIYPSGGPRVLRTRLLEAARKLYPDKRRTAMLVTSDVIAHIRVSATQVTIDPTSGSAPTAVLVTSEIVESIKGGRVPACWIDSHSKRDHSRTVTGVLAMPERDQEARSGACLQFEYRLEWPRLNNSMISLTPDSTLVEKNGKQWIQTGKEYIVFLRLQGLGKDQHYSYASLQPVSWFGSTCSMYPITNGRVYDPYDDFGFGVNLTPEEFKGALRGKINTIIHP